MTLIEVKCPKCGSNEVVKNGINKQEKQRYLCQNKEECGKSFILKYKNLGCIKEVKKQIIEMAINGSGIRDTARVLKINKDTVLNELKKKNQK